MTMKLFVGDDGMCHITQPDDSMSMCHSIIARGDSKLATKLNCPACLDKIELSVREFARYEKYLSAYSRMFGTLLNVARIPYRQDVSTKKKRNKDGSYEFIPHNTSDNVRAFIMLKQKLIKEPKWSGHKRANGRTKFLDAGCGIGNVMLTAKSCGLTDEAHGLELFDDTVAQARAFLGLTHDHRNNSWSDSKSYFSYKVYKRDIMTFKSYSHYDVIYFYCPFCDHDMQQKLEEHIENSMKIGAVLIRRLRKKPGLSTDPRFKRLTMKESYANVFMKIKG